jgi:hypothetical protein
MNCIWFEWLVRIPVAGLRMVLSRRHVNRCRRCFERSERCEEMPQLLVAAGAIREGIDLWPGVRKGIAASAAIPQPMRRPRHSLAIAAAAVALLLSIGIGLVVLGRRGRTPDENTLPVAMPHVRLHSARIADQPARVFQVQSRDPNRSIFWIAKNVPRS